MTVNRVNKRGLFLLERKNYNQIHKPKIKDERYTMGYDNDSRKVYDKKEMEFLNNVECCILLDEQAEEIKRLNEYCVACDDTLLLIQELMFYFVKKGNLKDKDNERLSFIEDCINTIRRLDLSEMENLKGKGRAYL